MSRLLLRLSVACLALLIAATAEAQALRYVDEYGVVHWVKSRDQIPEKYRDKVEKPQMPGVNSPRQPRSYKQDILEMCERDTSLQTKMQCEAWARREAQREAHEEERRLRQAELEQKRRERGAETEQRRREWEAQREEQRRLRQAERERLR
jgi:hypothetical protein